MRCRYCLPNGAPPPLPRDEILSFEEIARVTTVAARRGVRRVRLTGGEPLLRRNLPRLAEMLKRIEGVETLALTTNGLLLAEHLDALLAAGVDSISLSLDTVDAEDFVEETGVDALPKLLDLVGRLARTRRPDGAPLRVEINAVLRGGRADRIRPLLSLAREKGVPVRFIEMMPFQGISWREEDFLPASAVLAEAEKIGPYEELPRARPAAPARRFRFRDGTAFGVIAPVSEPFCASCDRLRLRSDGRLFNCLFDREGTDLRAILRDERLDEPARDEALAAAFEATVRAKGPGGMLDFDRQRSDPARVMAELGG